MQEQTFALCITYKNDDNELQTIVLDAVENNQINATNAITEHPIVSGDFVADHAYKNPITLAFVGHIANKGRKGAIVNLQEVSIVDFQNLLFDIRNNARLCDIVKIVTTRKDDVRFATYRNMVIESMTLIEEINTMQFTMNFRQVQLAQVQTLDVDPDDAFLPNIYEPETKSFTDTLIDWDQVMKAVVEYLSSKKLIEDGFLTAIASFASTGSVALVAGIGVAWLAAKLAIIASISRIAVMVAVVGVIAIGMVNLIKRYVNAYKSGIKPFKLYKNKTKQKQEYDRFAKLLDRVYKQFDKMNNVIHVYQLASDSDQECMLSIGDAWFTFTFTTNNTSGQRQCTVTDPLRSDAQVGSVVHSVEACPSTYFDCNTDNYVFKTNGSFVYLLNPNAQGEFTLSNCLIVVSDIDPADYNELMGEIVRNALQI